MQVDSSRYRIEPLGPETWLAFADLAERHNGVWGGCWCTWFHRLAGEPKRSADGNRAHKQELVKDDRAHAVFVFDADEAVAWCQYGTVDELPNIHHRKEWEGSARSQQPSSPPAPGSEGFEDSAVRARSARENR